MNTAVSVRLTIFFSISAILFVCQNSWGTSGEAGEHWSEKRVSVSRGIGYNKKKPAEQSEPTTTKRPTWRPKINGKLMLAKQKGLNVNDVSEIPEDDPDFIHAWADDYYDDYDFEHVRNMVFHGTFESRIQNYYKAELAEAMAKYNASTMERNDTIEGTTMKSDVKTESIILSTLKTTTAATPEEIQLKSPPTEDKMTTSTQRGRPDFMRSFSGDATKEENSGVTTTSSPKVTKTTRRLTTKKPEGKLKKPRR